MKFYVTRSEDDAFAGSFRYPFINATGDVEIEVACDLNITASNLFMFFNKVDSVTIKSNGYKVNIVGYGLVFKDISRVEVSGLTISNFIGDGVQLNNVSEYKVSNCSFVGHVSSSDEAISSVKGSGSKRGEISYNLFKNVNKGILCGTGDSVDSGVDEVQRVYIHHNWFKDFERRAPYCRQGIYCIYNNVFDGWKFNGDQTFCIWAEDGAKAIVVGNTFKQGEYSVFDGFPKRQISWFTKRPWCMDQGVVARLGATAFIRDNVKNREWIKINGVEFNEPVDLPEYEVDYVANVLNNAGAK